MTETELRHEIVRAGLSLYQRGYVHATAGNISCRLQDGGFLITPTDACLGLLRAEGIARIDAEGRHVAGDRPSKTLALHRHIYAQDAQANCVMHTHSTHLVALTLTERAPGQAGRPPPAHPAGVAAALGAVAGALPAREDAGPEAPDLLPPITPYFVMKVGHVPLIPYHRPGDPAVGGLVADAIRRAQQRGAPIRAVMLERLGPNVWGADPAQAMATLEELEETARLWLLTGARAAPLQAAQIEELRQAFGARW